MLFTVIKFSSINEKMIFYLCIKIRKKQSFAWEKNKALKSTIEFKSKSKLTGCYIIMKKLSEQTWEIVKDKSTKGNEFKRLQNIYKVCIVGVF